MLLYPWPELLPHTPGRGTHVVLIYKNTIEAYVSWTIVITKVLSRGMSACCELSLQMDVVLTLAGGLHFSSHRVL